MALTKIPANLLDKSAHVDFADNERLRIGTGNDLQIFHDSTNSIIDDTGNGILAIRTNGDSINLRKLSDNAEILVGKPDGAVELYHSGSKKLETSSTGATVTGTLAVTGDLDITGNVNSASVTDLDVTDKTITLGVGQTEAQSGGSGIVIDGSAASFTWDESNDRWLANKKLAVLEDVIVNANAGQDSNVEIGAGTTQNHYSYVDLIGDSTYTDYGLRIIRNNGGANTTAGIHHRGTGNLFIRTEEDAPIVFLTKMNAGGAERMRIVGSTGNVGIGTQTPQESLHTAGNIRFGDTAPAELYTNASELRLGVDKNNDNATSNITFYANDSEKVRIDASGRLVVGGAAAVATTGGTGAAQVLGTGNSDTILTLGRFSNNTGPAAINFVKSRNATIGGNTIVQDDDTLGSIVWAASDGTDLVSHAAKIDARVDGTPGTNDTPGRLGFFTTADGSQSAVERMRIDSSGKVGIGATSPDSNLIIANNDSSFYRFGYGGTSDVYLDSDAVYIRTDNGGANTATFKTNGLGIGTTTPDELLHVKGTNGAIAIDGNGSGNTASIKFINDNERSRITSAYGSGGGGVLTFHTDTTGGSLLERLRIDASGNVLVGTTTFNNLSTESGVLASNNVVMARGGLADHQDACAVLQYTSDAAWLRAYGDTAGSGYMVFRTGGGAGSGDTERMRLLAGGGLTFNGDTAQANALDDYEEGTWTPTVNDGTISGAGGHYTKIGRVVTVSYYYNLTTLGSSNGIVQIGGLPFAAKTASGDGHQTVGSILCRYFSKNQIVSYLGDNLSYLTYYNNGTGGFDVITFGEIEVSYDNDFAAHGTHTYITS